MQFRLMLSICGSLVLGACGDNQLDRETAENLLKDVVKSGTETLEIYPCSSRELTTFNNRGQQVNRCSQSFHKKHMPLYWVFVDKYRLLNPAPPNTRPKSGRPIIGLTDHVKENPELSKFFDRRPNNGAIPDRETIFVKIYDYRFGQVTGIRQNDDGTNISSNCTAIAEYTYERYDEAPWSEDYLRVLEAGGNGKPSSYQACFQRYDDGWRLVQK